ncbi:MAG: four helix bundle protein [Verrucomicrobia bacterium]|nr:four helix bundle protein [Verrucomicrobiota bacterium]
MNYETWLKNVPGCLTGDPLWKVEAYRLALFTADLGWHDITKLIKDKRTLDVSDQLYRALGSIGANVSKGYSRGSGKDRARFYEYALGSARESRGWYFNGRHVPGLEVAGHRTNLLTQIIRLLLTVVTDQRGDFLREESPAHQSHTPKTETETNDLPALLQNVPLP